MYRDHRKGPGGPPGGATYPGGPRGLKVEGNQPLGGWGTPLGPPPMCLGLGTLGGPAQGDGISKGGRRPKRGRVALPPKARGKLPPRVPNPRRMGGGPRGAPQPTKGWFPSTFSPRGPPGQVAPPGGPPGPFRWSRYNTGNPRNFPGGRNLTSYI